MNGAIFLVYFRHFLLPPLKPGDWVIMDSLAVYRVIRVWAAIESVGAGLLYLPPYSPDFNPIDMVFSKLKALLRKAAERTVDRLWDRIGKFMSTFSQQERRNFPITKLCFNLIRYRCRFWDCTRSRATQLLSATGRLCRGGAISDEID